MHKQELLGEDVFVLHGFLTPEECADAILKSERHGYEDAPISMGSGTIMVKDFRDNLRVVVDDTEFTQTLYARAKPFLPAECDGKTIVGLNERLRYYRYDVRQVFHPHYDGSFRRNEKEQSLLTFMIYLNADCEGGTTDFYEGDDDEALLLSVQPEAGKALIFRHELLHGGASVTSGRKYVLRTDILYTVTP